jgi:hypothetical protein
MKEQLQREKTKRELVYQIGALRHSVTLYKSREATRIGQIRHFRRRLLKIRNEIEYLLEHPWSRNNGYSQKSYDKKIKWRPTDGKI